MKFTTPATASDPYAADAPPVTMSVRDIIASGIRLMSGRPRTPDGTMRWPSSSVSVRLTPTPRRFRNPCPDPEKLIVVVATFWEFASTGNCSSAAVKSPGEMFFKSAVGTTVTGVGASAPFVMSREPVTTTVSTGGDAWSCAKDGAAAIIGIAAASTSRLALRPAAA